MEECAVPELLDIFTKILLDKRNFCFLCLRTSDETRLVKPNYINKFTEAVKISTRGTANFICHICERLAHNALKLFRAAVFASSIGLILRELANRDIRNTALIFERRYFKRVLNKAELSTQLTPEAIDKEVKIIRKHSCLSETEVLVMDNKQVYEGTILPDVAVTTTQDKQIKNQDKKAKSHGSTQHCPESILPDSGDAQDSQSDKTLTYVILDDEDESKATPAEPKQIIPTVPNPASNLNDNLVVTFNPPNLIPFQELIKQPQTNANFLLHPIFLSETGQLNVPSLSAVIINGHLVVYDSGNKIINKTPLGINMDVVKQSLMSNNEVFIQNCDSFLVPSKSCELLVLNPNNNTENTILNLNENQNVQLVDTNPNSNLTTLTVPSSNLILTSQSTNSTVNGKNPHKKMRVDGSVLPGLPPLVKCKDIPPPPLVKGSGIPPLVKGKGTQMQNVKISDVSSDQPKAKPVDNRTDWEDKIPMDVISFVDAVDPNADSLLRPQKKETCDMQVGNVRSLAVGTIDIIDLS